MYECSICNKANKNQKKGEIEIKYCISCALRSDTKFKVTGHEHEVTKTDRSTGWGCDGRKNTNNCLSNNSTSGILRFRCDACDYDNCEYCLAHYIDKSFYENKK